MKIMARKTLMFCLMVAAMVLSLWEGQLMAETYDLATGVTTVTMPDGKPVVMWGYAQCTSNDATFANCTTVTVPGPRLTSTDGTLTVNLQNNLTEPTSIVINGQKATEVGAMVPTWTDDTIGPRAGDITKRVRSFTHEASAKVGAIAGTATYEWSDLRPGTYLYQTGTHPAKQVQMGLYGAMTYDDGAYPGVGFASDAVLLFSEIDQQLHDAVASGTYGTAAFPSTIKYVPEYFLINGQAFPATSTIPIGAAGNTVLLRLLNAGLDNREVVVQGQRPTLYGEDGNLLPFIFQHNSLLLPAGKTLDATIAPAANGYLPVYDRRLGLSNAGSSPGGMLAYLQTGGTPDQTLNVAKTGTGSGTVTTLSAPGGISCGADCSETYLNGTELLLSATPAAGSAFDALWAGCDSVVGGNCLLTMNGVENVSASFRQITAVKVLAPNGGESIQGGSNVTIRWEAPLAAVKFNVFYTLNNGTTWKRIGYRVAGTSFNWTVPVPAATKTKCRVRVVGLNAANVVVGKDRSDLVFTVTLPIGLTAAR